MKFLLLIVVLALAVGWVFTRSRRGKRGPPPAPNAPVRPAQGDTPAAAATTAMLVCAHCQVHLPQDEAQFDVAGKPYCSAEHCVAGPR